MYSKTMTIKSVIAQHYIKVKVEITYCYLLPRLVTVALEIRKFKNFKRGYELRLLTTCVESSHLFALTPSFVHFGGGV